MSFAQDAPVCSASGLHGSRYKIAVMRKATLTLIFGLGLLRAQQTRLEFEVASIKVAPPQPIGRISSRTSTNSATQSEPGRLNYTYVNVQQVLCEAYRVFLYQLSGGPAWLETDRFDISAVIPAGTQRDQVPLMLQALLADRFKLAPHRENEGDVGVRIDRG